MNKMLNITGLNFGYKKNAQILHGINLSLKPGFTLLVGENGSGKTTLMRCMTGTLRGTGTVDIDGVPCGSKEYAHMISYLPQVFDVYPTLKVKEILAFVAHLKGVARGEIANTVAQAAEFANISSFMDKSFRKCSEGMKHRVGIAASLIGDPQVVILDEPTAGVDPRERRQFYRSMCECFTGKTVLISTHVFDDIDSLADNIIMLSHGRVTCHMPYANFLTSLGREATLEELWLHYQEGQSGAME